MKNSIEGKIRVEFDSEVDYFASIAKDLILTTLDEYGARLPELQTWNLSEAKGNAIEISGRLSEDSLRHILQVVSAPSLSFSADSYTSKPNAPIPPAPATDQPPPEPGKDTILRASQNYYRGVTDILGSLKKLPAETSASMRLWYDRAAKQIEELPISERRFRPLGMGSQIARSVRGMSSGINYAAKDTNYRIAGTANGYYGGYYYGGPSRSVEAGVIRKQYVPFSAFRRRNLAGAWKRPWPTCVSK